jgi:cellulose synthase operon protein C
MQPARIVSRSPVSIAAVLVLALACVAPAGASLDGARADLEAGNLSAATEQLRAMLRNNEKDPEANVLLAQAYLDNQQPHLALVALAKAEEGGHPHDDLLPLYARAWRLSGDYATLELETANLPADMVPDTRDAVRIQRALGQLARGNSQQAAVILSELVEGPLGAEARAALAQVMRATGQLDRAEELALAAIELDAANVDAWIVRGDIAEAKGDDSAAERAYTGAFAIAGGRAWMVRARRADLRLRLGNLDGVAEDIDVLAAAKPDYAGLRYLRGVLSLERGNAAAAADLLNAALREHPSDPRVMYATGRAMLAAGRLQQALDLAERLSGAQPDNVNAVRLLALAQSAAGDQEAAIATLDGLILRQEQPTVDLLMDYASVLAASADRSDEAVSVLMNVIARGDAPQRARLQLAALLLERGDNSAALAPVRAYRQEFPLDAAAALLEIRALLGLGQSAEAQALARDLAASNPGSAQAQMALSLASLGAGDDATARAALAQADALAPGALPMRLELARRDMQAGRVDEARARIADLAAHYPSDARLVLTAAELEYGRTQDADALVATLRQALQRNRQDPLLRRNLVSTLLQLGRPTEAQSVLAEVRQTIGNDPDMLQLQIAVAQAINDPALARASVEALLQLDPDAAPAHHALARILAATGGGRDMTEALYRALRADPGSTDAIVTLQAVMRATAAPADRKAIIDRLQQTLPGEPIVQFAIADEAMADTRYADAASAYEDVLAAAPDNRAALLGLVLAALRQGEYRDAAKATAAWLARNPRDAGIRYEHAFALERAGDMAGATAAYEALLKDSPTHWMAMNNLAMLLTESDPKRALSLAEGAHALNRDSAAILDTLGLAALANGQVARAVAALSAAHESAPTDPTIALHFAQTLIADDREAEALRMLRELSMRPFAGQADAQALLQQLTTNP